MDQEANRAAVQARSRWYALAALLLVALTSRAYRLNSQLWIDEISALTESISRPLSRILTEWPGVSSHVLYEALARLGGLTLGFDPVGLRLPAALFGVGGVWLIYALAKRLKGEGYALFVGGLLAVSYHHVFYSQNARGYTALIFLSLVSFLLFLKFQQSGALSRNEGWLYATTNALLAYVQPFGVFVPASNFLVALGLTATRQRGDRPGFPIRPFVGSTVGAAVITMALYAPFVPGMLAHARANATSEAEGPRLGVDLAGEVIEGLAAAFGGPWGLALVGVLGLCGFIMWARRHPIAALVLCLPPVLEAVTFAVAGFGLHPRYFAVALPAVFLVAGYAIFELSHAAAKVLAPRRATSVASALLGLVVILSALPLIDYYRLPKQDFQGAYQFVEARAATPDARLGVHSAGTALAGYFDSSYTKVESLEDLRRLESGAGTTWLVMTLERITERSQPDLYEAILERYERLATFPGSVGDGAVTVYRLDASP